MTAQLVFEENNTYNTKVNLDLIDHLKQQSPDEERIITLMSHIVNAHQIWLERIHGKPNSTAVFEVHTLDQLKEQVIANAQLTTEILNSAYLDKQITYQNTKGQTFVNSISQILLHVFNHSSYHRGQINQLLVKEGKKAMITDYIFYNRTEVI